MAVVSIAIGVLLLLIVLWDTFETIVLPRTVTRNIRLTRLFYLTLWGGSVALIRRLPRDSAPRSLLLNTFGPLSLLLLLIFWACCLILAFALILWGFGLNGFEGRPHTGFFDGLYQSGSTFVTLGLGVAPVSPLFRFLVILEAGTGFVFIAIVIGYVPIIYQAFSRREVGISLLDARAGSPPTGAELLRRYSEAGQMEDLIDLLREWERWASDMMESHLSYPALVFYRSQHDRESWLSAMTAVLDACALLQMGLEHEPLWRSRLEWQARLTFAMARHAVIDLSLVLHNAPEQSLSDRLTPETLHTLQARLHLAGLPLRGDEAALVRLNETRRQYEPYVDSLARRLMLDLPPWLPDDMQADNWQTSAWDGPNHFR